MAIVIFADHSAVANPDGELIKVGLTMRTGAKEYADTGTVVLTKWAATQLVASLCEALKEASKQSKAEVILMEMKKTKRAAAKLAAEPWMA